MPSSHEKTEMNSVLLEIDPVFMYRIGDNLKSCLKASEWDTLNPTWNGKLHIVEVSSNRRQVQFVNSRDGIFGVVANKEDVRSPMFQKVLDSNRYFTTEIKNTKSGKNEVIGIGFINRFEGSKLLSALDHYFTSKDDGRTNNGPMKCIPKDQIKVEMKIEVPENSQVEVELNTLQESQSDRGTHIRCHRDRWHADATTNILAHTRKGQEKRAGPSHDEHNVENSILTRATESESTTDSNSEGETPCSIPKKMKIESQSQDQNELEINLMHIDAQPEQSDSQDSVDSFNAVQEPSEECGSISLSSEVLPNNKTGTFCLDPITRELICPFCGFNTHAKNDMKLLLSHWQKDGDMEAISTCRLCYIIFSTPEQRLKHINALHIKCDICSKEFKKKRKKLLDLHMDRVHNCNDGQVERDDTALDEHNVEERILSSGGEGNNYGKEEGEITSDDNSEEEAPCMISETEKIELWSHSQKKHEIELMHIDSPSEKNVGQETMDSVSNVQELSGPCVPNFLPLEGVSGNNENGTFCLDPVTLELICPLCSFKTDSKYEMKLLLSHWREDHDMTRHDTCRFCFTLFSTPEQRLSHLKVHNYVCAICLHEIKSKKQFVSHIIKWHTVKQGFVMSADIDNNHHTCNRCSKEFENTNDLIDHFSLANSATQCSSATTKVQEHETGSTYSRQISRRNQFICHLCPISKFSSFKLNDIYHHWETEHDLRKPITCTLCHHIFLTEEQRLYHVIALHTVCSVCSVEFGKPKSRDLHMKRVHSFGGVNSEREKERPIALRYDLEPTSEGNLSRDDEDKCDAEADVITIDDNSVSHLNAHYFICSICSLELTEKKHLLRHIEIWHLKLRFRMSSNNNNHYRCNRCSKEFENINELMNHFRPTNTTTQRPLLSSVTSAEVPTTTTTIQEYENGINYFSQVDGKNQFVCHLCPTATFYAWTTKDLLEHWKTEHDLREPSTSTCRLCHLFFSTPEHRLHHINALHIVCSVCTKEFTKRRSHNFHMRKVHKTPKRQDKRADTTLDAGQPTTQEK